MFNRKKADVLGFNVYLFLVLLFLNIFFKVPVTAVTTSNYYQNFGCMNIDSNMTNFIEEADKSGK